MSLLDRGYARFGRGTLFRGGWGDLGLLTALEALSRNPPPPESIALRRDGRYIRFRSPAAGELPSEAAEAHAWEIPARGPERGACVVLAATGEIGPERRARRFGHALANRGIRSIVLENPYYGLRTPTGQTGTNLRHAVDLAAMFGATVREAAALLAHLRNETPRVGVVGFSMGGQAAAVTAALCPFPVRVAACLAPHSGRAVFEEGVLAGRVAWDVLGDSAEARARFRALVLEPGDVARYPMPVEAHRTVLVAGRTDAVVPPGAAEALRALRPGATLTWIPGGHVWGWLMGNRAFADAAVAAMAD